MQEGVKVEGLVRQLKKRQGSYGPLVGLVVGGTGHEKAVILKEQRSVLSLAAAKLITPA